MGCLRRLTNWRISSSPWARAWGGHDVVRLGRAWSLQQQAWPRCARDRAVVLRIAHVFEHAGLSNHTVVGPRRARRQLESYREGVARITGVVICRAFGGATRLPPGLPRTTERP
jgi:hypothetical protein